VHFAIIAGILFTPMIPIQKFVGKWVFGLALILIFVSLGKFDIVFSYLVLPITLLIFYIPYSDLKTKLLYILIALASAVLAIEFRANFMRIGVGLFIVLLYYGKVFENRLFKIALKPVQVLTFVLPVFLLYLGITGQFNIFSDLFTSAVMTTNVNGDENLAADTRTFLYYEVFRSLINEEAFIFGLGASGSYESYSFSYLVDNRRYASETGFLNVLLNMGIVGVVSYFFVLYSASYYALFRSNNSLAKMIGLFLIFRWVLFFVEDMTAYGVSMYFLWISIGLCYSNRFRNLTDADLVSLLKAPKVG
jgi:O-antigen ligase